MDTGLGKLEEDSLRELLTSREETLLKQVSHSFLADYRVQVRTRLAVVTSVSLFALIIAEISYSISDSVVTAVLTLIGAITGLNLVMQLFPSTKLVLSAAVLTLSSLFMVSFALFLEDSIRVGELYSLSLILMLSVIPIPLSIGLLWGIPIAVVLVAISAGYGGLFSAVVLTFFYVVSVVRMNFAHSQYVTHFASVSFPRVIAGLEEKGAFFLLGYLLAQMGGGIKTALISPRGEVFWFHKGKFSVSVSELSPSSHTEINRLINLDGGFRSVTLDYARMPFLLRVPAFSRALFLTCPSMEMKSSYLLVQYLWPVRYLSPESRNFHVFNSLCATLRQLSDSVKYQRRAYAASSRAERYLESLQASEEELVHDANNVSQESESFLVRALRTGDAGAARKVLLFLRYISARYQIRQLLERQAEPTSISVNLREELESVSDFVETVGMPKSQDIWIEMKQPSSLIFFLNACSWLLQKRHSGYTRIVGKVEFSKEDVALEVDCDRELTDERIKGFFDLFYSERSQKVFGMKVLVKPRSFRLEFKRSQPKVEEGVTIKTKSDSKTCIFIDDNEGALKFYARVSKAIGVEALLARSVEEARALSTEFPAVDLVVSDYELPDGNGLDVASFFDLSRIPMIFVTGRSEKSLEEEVRRRGARELLVKPVSQKVLVERLRHFMV